VRRKFSPVLIFEYFTSKPQNIENRAVIDSRSHKMSPSLAQRVFRGARCTPIVRSGVAGKLSKSGRLHYSQIANITAYILSVLRGVINEKVIPVLGLEEDLPRGRIFSPKRASINPSMSLCRGCLATFAGKLMFGRVGAPSATEILMLPFTGVARKATMLPASGPLSAIVTP
jgi:hypothetical protein